MHLFKEPFELIKDREKTIEVRLFDDKRRKIRVGDTIIFKKLPNEDEELRCRVIGLSIFGSFEDLFRSFEKSKFGHPKSMSLKEQLRRSYKIYRKSDEKRYGVVGIHVERL